MINDLLGWSGSFVIKSTNLKTGEVTENTVKNRITNTALQAIINILDNVDPDLDIKYLAIGTDNTPLNDNDTQLGNEIFRTQFLTSNNSATGQFTTTFAVLDNEAVGQWEEIGIFCGNSATSTANTGTLLSRILFSRNKSNLEEIDISRIDTVTRA